MSYKFKSKEFDPTKVPTGGGNLPPAGSIVAVKIVGKQDGDDMEWTGTVETKSAAGNPMLRVHAVVCSGYPGEGAWLLDYIVLNTDYTNQRIGMLLAAVGLDIKNDYALSEKVLIGRCGYVKVKHEMYEDKPRAKIAYWIPPALYEKHNLQPILEEGADAGEESGGSGGGEKAPWD